METVGPHLDLFDPALNADPFPVWDELRAIDPVWRWEDADGWVVTGLAELEAVLRDPRFSPSRRYWSAYEPPEPVAEPRGWARLEDHALFHVTTADHTRLRRLVTKAFTPQGIQTQQPFTQALVDRLVEGWEPGSYHDLAQEVSYAVPSRVIANLLGLRDADAQRFVDLAEDFLSIVDPMVTPEAAARADDAIEEVAVLLADELGAREALPADERPDDLLARLIAAEDEGDRLTHAEMEALVISLVFAGTDTTANQISHGMIALLRHPDQRDRLVADPSLLEVAVEEVLRFGPPGKAMPHFAVEDVELGGHLVRKGQPVFFVMGGANRDPRAVADPNRFDLSRDNAAMVPFGIGAHYCLGAALARLELRTVIGTLVARFPAMALAGEPELGMHVIMRPVLHLPVVV